jgi:hypothetical protein
MVIKNIKRVTASRAAHKPSFVIHLPHVVRVVSLKRHETASLRLPGRNLVVTVQNVSDRCWGRHINVPQVQQATPDLASTPRWMLLTHLKHLGLNNI